MSPTLYFFGVGCGLQFFSATILLINRVIPRFGLGVRTLLVIHSTHLIFLVERRSLKFTYREKCNLRPITPLLTCLKAAPNTQLSSSLNHYPKMFRFIAILASIVGGLSFCAFRLRNCSEICSTSGAVNHI